MRSVTYRIALRTADVSPDDSVHIANDDKDPITKAGEHLTSFLPSGLIAWFIPLWAAVVAAESVAIGVRFWIALGFAILTFVFVWGVGHQKARIIAQKGKKAVPSPWTTLRVGFWAIAAATAAAFAWATVVPESWAGFTQPYQPLVVGGVVGLTLSGLSFFFGDLPED